MMATAGQGRKFTASCLALAKLRPYQERVIESVQNKNAIVKMPTGSGKTIVAAEVVRRKLQRNKGRAALFLVPKHALVEQQAVVLQDWCSQETRVFQFMGGLSDPPKESGAVNVCIVSTPKAFHRLQQRKKDAFGWKEFGIVVFDEVHHMLKDHPYRDIALGLQEWRKSSIDPPDSVQILGLSASLTYCVEEKAIRKTLTRLCRELSIQQMESPSIQELEDGGYVHPHGRNVEMESCIETPEGVIEPSVRKPHLMHQLFIKRVQDGTATPFTLKLWTVIKELEKRAKESVTTFQSPLSKAKLASWEAYAHKLALYKLENWYVALRLLVQSWEEEELLVMEWLKMTGAFDDVSCKEALEIKAMAEAPGNFFKLGRLRHHLLEKRKEKGKSFRCIVFVEQRITAVIVSHLINNDTLLSSLGLQSGYVTAHGSTITPTIQMTKKEATETIQDFRTNQRNVIVATSVIEEGFDVPAANVVISFDHLKNSVELCQRFGRARQNDSSIVLLAERSDRPLALLESVRDLQDTIVEDYEPSNVSIDTEAEKSNQQNRERSAFNSVFRNGPGFRETPLLSLNRFVKQTKATLLEDFSNRKGGGFDCSLTYRSILRTLKVDSSATKKRDAKRACAVEMLILLEKSCRASY